MPTPPHILRLRQFVGHERLLAVAAVAAIFDDHGRLLLGRRSDYDEEIWGFPGGAMEPGESITDALAREVMEESGLRIEPARMIGVYSSPEYTVTYPNGDETQYVMLLFRCIVTDGQPRSDEDEMLEWRYFNQELLPPMRPCCQAKAADAFADRSGTIIR